MPRLQLREVTRERAAAVGVKIRAYTYIGLTSFPVKRITIRLGTCVR